MHSSLRAIHPSGRIPVRTPPLIWELNYTLQLVDGRACLSMSSGRAGNVADAWVRTGTGGLLCCGPSHRPAPLMSPLAIELTNPRFVRDHGLGPSFSWVRQADGTVLMHSESLELAACTLVARLTEMLEDLGAPPLDDAGDVITPTSGVRRVSLHRRQRTWRLRIETLGEETVTWIANDRSGWRTHWRW